MTERRLSGSKDNPKEGTGAGDDAKKDEENASKTKDRKKSSSKKRKASESKSKKDKKGKKKDKKKKNRSVKIGFSVIYLSTSLYGSL